MQKISTLLIAAGIITARFWGQLLKNKQKLCHLSSEKLYIETYAIILKFTEKNYFPKDFFIQKLNIY